MTKRNIFFALILGVFSLMACENKQANGSKTAIVALPAKEFQEKMQEKNVVVLDVRSPEEYQEGHLKDAENIDVNADNFNTKLENLDKEKTYFVYCLKGKRSNTAAEKMKEMGFKNLYELKGGLDSWRKTGLKITKS